MPAVVWRQFRGALRLFVMDLVTSLQRDVDSLAAVDLSAWTLEEVQAFAVAAEQQAGRLRGIASAALGLVAAADPEGVAWWWRDSLGITGEAAGHAVRRARGLAVLGEVSSAVADGTLSLEQAGALVPLVGKLPEVELHDSQPLLVEGARGRTVDAIGQWVRMLIAQHSEEDLELEQQEAAARRYLRYRHGPDGMTRGSFAFPTESTEGFCTAIEAHARREGLEDLRTAKQRRADALLDLVDAGLRFADLPQTGGERAHVSYVMSAEWAAQVGGSLPPVGAWTGPQTRPYLEAICCDARISRVLLDDAGQVRGLESVRGNITRWQRKAVSARDRHCVALGCTRPPAFSDVHHLISREDGGPTTVENLCLLCRRHHVMWHRGELALSDLRIPWYQGPGDARAGPSAA